jgi:hypothetical protein
MKKIQEMDKGDVVIFVTCTNRSAFEPFCA